LVSRQQPRNNILADEGPAFSGSIFNSSNPPQRQSPIEPDSRTEQLGFCLRRLSLGRTLLRITVVRDAFRQHELRHTPGAFDAHPA
jgi:hypothetical protein